MTTFFSDEDLLYDVSPLPKDDDSSNHTLLEEEIERELNNKAAGIEASCSLQESEATALSSETSTFDEIVLTNTPPVHGTYLSLLLIESGFFIMLCY